MPDPPDLAPPAQQSITPACDSSMSANIPIKLQSGEEDINECSKTDKLDDDVTSSRQFISKYNVTNYQAVVHQAEKTANKSPSDFEIESNSDGPVTDMSVCTDGKASQDLFPISIVEFEDQCVEGVAARLAGRRPAMTMQQVVIQARATARLRKAVLDRRARKQNQEKQQDRKAAKMLSAILLAFIVTWTPYNVFILVQVFCADCVPMTMYNIGKN